MVGFRTCLPHHYLEILHIIREYGESSLRSLKQMHEQVELVSRGVTVLLQIHHNQLITTPSARPVLIQLKNLLHHRVKECKDILGFNLAAMDHLKQFMSLRSDAPFRDAKTKLLEIRSWHFKRHEEKMQLKNERKWKKKKT